MKHLLKAAQITTDDDEALSLAIDTVATSRDEKLANQLIDFLLGADGIPKVSTNKNSVPLVTLYIKYQYV